MAKIWKTGVARSAALRGMSPVGSPRSRSRKPRSAANLRARMKARAARRCASTEGEHTASRTPSEATIVEDRASEAVGVTTSEAAEPGEMPHGEARKPVSDITKVSAVCDNHVAFQAAASTVQPGASNYPAVQTDGDGFNCADDGGWACMVCTYRNSDAVVDCANCNCHREDAVPKFGDGVGIQDAVTTSKAAIDADRVATSTIPPTVDTVGAATGTTRVATATVQAANGTDRVTANHDQMYYPIYGKYYIGSDVTVSSDYATTVQTWKVTRINDRRDTARGHEYQVLWIRRQKESRRYYLRSWEPRYKLLEDNFQKEVDLVDRWMASDVEKFEVFWKNDEYGESLLGTDTEGLCLFNALKRAAELAGRPEIVTQQDIDPFVQDKRSLYNRDLTKGTKWEVARRFLRRLRDARRAFVYSAMVKNNSAVAGRRGARVLEEIPLVDGIYIVAAYNHSFIGHCIVLTVQGNKRLIYDLKEGKSVPSAEDWINFYAFVRPFIVFK